MNNNFQMDGGDIVIVQFDKGYVGGQDQEHIIEPIRPNFVEHDMNDHDKTFCIYGWFWIIFMTIAYSLVYVYTIPTLRDQDDKCKDAYCHTQVHGFVKSCDLTTFQVQYIYNDTTGLCVFKYTKEIPVLCVNGTLSTIYISKNIIDSLHGSENTEINPREDCTLDYQDIGTNSCNSVHLFTALYFSLVLFVYLCVIICICYSTQKCCK